METSDDLLKRTNFKLLNTEFYHTCPYHKKHSDYRIIRELPLRLSFIYAYDKYAQFQQLQLLIKMLIRKLNLDAKLLF